MEDTIDAFKSNKKIISRNIFMIKKLTKKYITNSLIIHNVKILFNQYIQNIFSPDFDEKLNILFVSLSLLKHHEKPYDVEIEKITHKLNHHILVTKYTLKILIENLYTIQKQKIKKHKESLYDLFF